MTATATAPTTGREQNDTPGAGSAPAAGQGTAPEQAQDANPLDEAFSSSSPTADLAPPPASLHSQSSIGIEQIFDNYQREGLARFVITDQTVISFDKKNGTSIIKITAPGGQDDLSPSIRCTVDSIVDKNFFNLVDRIAQTTDPAGQKELLRQFAEDLNNFSSNLDHQLAKPRFRFPESLTEFASAIADLNSSTPDSTTISVSPDSASLDQIVAMLQGNPSYQKVLTIEPAAEGGFNQVTFAIKNDELTATLHTSDSAEIELRLGSTENSGQAITNMTQVIQALKEDMTATEPVRSADLTSNSSLLKLGLFQNLQANEELSTLNPEGITIARVSGVTFSKADLRGAIFKNTTFEKCTFSQSSVCVSGTTTFEDCVARNNSRFLAVGENTDLRVVNSDFDRSTMLYGEARTLDLKGEQLKFRADALELNLQPGGITSDATIGSGIFGKHRDILDRFGGFRFRKSMLAEVDNLHSRLKDVKAKSYEKLRKTQFVGQDELARGFSNSSFARTFPGSDVANNTQQVKLQFGDGEKQINALIIPHPTNSSRTLFLIPDENRNDL
ncbi:MAG: pentapeptide repeat-containing protein, partial [Bdellovibrionales bacterium]|nr:pentapeptide repeat-containing protein [Bdellovibrionales bacterium]